MLPGAFDGGDVRELTTYAIVNNVRRNIESVSLDAEITGDLPEQVASGGGVSGRSGTIQWAQSEDVQSRELSPWHKPTGWPPRPGDRVKVYVTDGVTTWPRFTGTIDRTSGTVGGGMQSTVIDDRDKLNGTFTHEALLRHHVPYAEGNAYRSIGLNHWYPLTMALRSAKVYNLPYMVAEIAVSAPMQGSVWPEAGTVLSATGEIAGSHAAFFATHWGYAAASFSVTYLPRTAEPPSSTLLMVISVAPEHAGTTTFDATFGTYAVRIRVDATRGVQAFRAGVEICRLTAAQMSGATVVTLLVKAGVWRLENDKRIAATGAGGPLSNIPMSSVSVVADSASRVAGFQVSKPASTAHEIAPLTFNRNMRFTPGTLASTMDMMPRIEGRNIADLVDEICKATLTAAWFDESGMLQLVSTDKLRSADSSQTITTLDDITDLGWEESLLSVRSKVEVAWKDPSISKGRQQRKELYRASGDTLVSADNVEIVAEPGTDTEWFGADRSPRVLNTSNWGVYNRRTGSFAGYYYSANGETTAETGLTMSVTKEMLGTAGVKINHVAGTYPSDVEATLGTSPTATALWPFLRNHNLPVIRGYGEGKWVDAVHTSTITGPSYAPTLSHELGYWGHRFFEGGSVAERVANFIAGMVTSPTPTLSGVEVTYDPRRQVGDVVTIQSGVLDVTIHALVVGIGEHHVPGDHSQSLVVRIIDITSTRNVSYSELEEAWSGGTYAGLQAVWSGLSYNNLSKDPTQGAPNQ